MHFARLGTLATVATVGIMYLLIVIVFPLISTQSILGKIGIGGAGVVLSFGIFKALSSFLLKSFKKNVWLRRKLLGRSFLEGTWVGYFEHAGGRRFTVEYFRQETGRLTIEGTEYDETGKMCSSWRSNAAAIDLISNKLFYAYSCDVQRRPNEQQGIGVFNLKFRKKDKSAHIIDGYAADLIDGDKDANCEHKISNIHMGTKQALKIAHEIFLQDKLPRYPKL